MILNTQTTWISEDSHSSCSEQPHSRKIGKISETAFSSAGSSGVFEDIVFNDAAIKKTRKNV